MESTNKVPKNVIIFITDQERAVQHFPECWEEENLPGLTKLKKHGLSFENAFTNACMCSAARSTWLSGYFPAQHGVKYTLEENMEPPENPQVELPLDLKNIATVISGAGFCDENIVYKGKWHCSKPRNDDDNKWVPKDLADYGFARWNPRDAGADQSVPEGGGAPGTSWENEGDANNDERFMCDAGEMEAGKEGVMAYLNSLEPDDDERPPFFLIISLVNPHDVLFYPNDTSFPAAGYDESWLEGDIGIPETGNPDDEGNYDDLSTKPKIQKRLLTLLNQSELGELETPEEMRNYIRFYGNLMKSSDKYLEQVLEKLDDKGLREDTLIIRTADHGEMGLAHGGLRQKNFNFYEESIRVPLVYSNPCLYPEPITSQALVSHVDFLPTLAGLFDAPPSARADDWQGIDYSSLVLDPCAESESPQDYVVFTYDDFQSGQKSDFYPPQPNHIVSLREERYKLAKYYDPDRPNRASEWEMYDLCEDPLETTNIAYEIENGNQDAIEKYGAEYDRLKDNLQTEVWEGRLSSGVPLSEC